MDDGSDGKAATSRSATHGRAPARGRPLVLLVTILLSVGAFVYLDGRAPALVVHTEPANAPSPRPAFMPSSGVEAVPQKSVHTVGHAVTGDMAGLYGGTKSNTCDATAIADFLATNPAQAGAWAKSLLISPGDIARYLGTLTPLTLRTDTAVTNHGFENGSTTPFQSVLQAGTAVLVDAEGLPRVRCYCGNPLQVPAPRTDVDIRNVSFEGPRWEGFEPESVTTVDPAPAQIDTFVVLNQDNDTVVIRPRSTHGEKDRSVSADVDKVARRTFVPNGGKARAAGAPESPAGLVPYGGKTSSRSGALIAKGEGQLGAGAPSDTDAATGALAPTDSASPSVSSSASVGAPTAASGPPEGGGGPTSAGSQALVVTTSSSGGGTTPTTTSKATTSKTSTSRSSATKTTSRSSATKTTSRSSTTRSSTTRSSTSKSSTSKSSTSKTTTSKATTSRTTTKAAAEETESD